MYPGDPGDPGSDCSGIIVRCSSGSGGGDSDGSGSGTSMPLLLPGTPVFGLTTGCLGSHVVSSSETVVALPPNISFEDAAASPTIHVSSLSSSLLALRPCFTLCLTAIIPPFIYLLSPALTQVTADAALLGIAALRSGERVLLHAAAGGVGLAALQVAAAAGATAAGTAGGPPKRALLRSLGARHAAGSRDIMFTEDLSLLLSFSSGTHPAPESGAIHVVLNTLTSPGMVASSLSLLAHGGRLVEISKRDVVSAARVLQERPDVSYSLLAVDFLPPPVLHVLLSRLSRRLAAGEVRPIRSVCHPLRSVAAALRQMSQARHVGKVVVSAQRLTARVGEGITCGPAAPAEELLPGACGSSGGAVLVTGGLGALGSLLATWLSCLGATRIILVGRTGRVPPSSADTHSEAAAGGGLPQGSSACVTLVRCDASCTSELQAALLHHAPLVSPGTPAGTPCQDPCLRLPLAAVFHAGGLLADAALRNQNLSGARGVLAPKLNGQSALRDLSLLGGGCAHVLFSSVASLLGSPGQANYSAANAALDAAAAGMAAAGLPALSIQWGAWAGGGMAAQTAAKNEAAGIGALKPDIGLGALECALAASAASPQTTLGSVVLAISPFNWATFADRLRGDKDSSASAAVAAFLADLLPLGDAQPKAGSASGPRRSRSSRRKTAPRDAIDAGGDPHATERPATATETADAIRARVLLQVQAAAQRVIGSGAAVPLDAPLMSSGLDSLGAVELRNSLESTLGVALPSTLVFDYPTVDAVAGFASAAIIESGVSAGISPSDAALVWNDDSDLDEDGSGSGSGSTVAGSDDEADVSIVSIVNDGWRAAASTTRQRASGGTAGRLTTKAGLKSGRGHPSSGSGPGRLLGLPAGEGLSPPRVVVVSAVAHRSAAGALSASGGLADAITVVPEER